MPRQLLDSQIIYQGPIFEVERDRLREDSGVEIVREVVKHPGGAGGLPFLDDGRVALVKQYRHPARKELLEIPAGRIERSETPEECAAREIEGEVGVHVGRMEKLAEFYTTPGFCEEKLYIYLARDLTPAAQRLDHDEFIEVVWLPFADALRWVREGKIEDAKTIIALLLAAEAPAMSRDLSGCGSLRQPLR